jgi:hypothetical protein
LEYGASRGLEILDEIDRRFDLSFTTHSLHLMPFPELLWFPYSPAFADSSKGETFNSGPEMIPKLS